MEHLSTVAACGRRSSAGASIAVRTANDNGGRRVLFSFAPPPTITIAEIEVFGALLADIGAPAANDNYISGDAA